MGVRYNCHAIVAGNVAICEEGYFYCMDKDTLEGFLHGEFDCYSERLSDEDSERLDRAIASWDADAWLGRTTGGSLRVLGVDMGHCILNIGCCRFDDSHGEAIRRAWHRLWGAHQREVSEEIVTLID